MKRFFCPAKINLFLSIKGRDERNYHLVDTVLYRTNTLKDELRLEPSEKLSVSLQGFGLENLPMEDNLVTRAVRLLEQETGRTFSYKIHIQKEIPPGSGLGGGSSNAATILQVLNEEEHLGISSEQLQKWGAKLGVDIPFFLTNTELALGTHYGEEISPLGSLPKEIHYQIFFRSVPQNTAEAYRQWDEKGLQTKGDLPAFLEALKTQNAALLLSYFSNDFEQIFPLDEVETKPGEYAVLTGSGSAYVKFWLSNPV